MQYLSPSTLLGESISTPLDKKALQLGRKKLLAELELTSGDSIEIQGVALTKGNIIDYFEALQLDNIIYYHNAIEEDRVLKDFLEAHAIEQGFRFREDPLYDDIHFIQWISPYFKSAFTSIADICFRTSDYGELKTILANRLIMTDYDLEETWVFITRILTNNIAMLEYYRDNGEKGIVEEETFNTASHLMSYEYITLIELLPEHRFSEVRNKYAFVIEQAAIFTFNKKPDHRTAAEAWIENALKLAVAPELKTELSNKLVEMRGISGGKKSKSWGIARFAWLAIFILAKLFSNNSYDSTPKFNYNIPQVTMPVLKLKDSNQTSHSDTGRFNYNNLKHTIDSMANAPR